MATVASRDDYFRAALEILSSDGFGGLKLAPVCKSLKVTTGSFYNYFGSWPEFKTKFLRRWLEDRTLQLVALARLEAAPAKRLDLLVDFACNLPHRAEAAIRTWSHNDPEVRRIQAEVDAQRASLVSDTMNALISDRELAEHFARLALYIFVGFEQLDPQQDVAHLRWSLRTLIDDLSRSVS